MFRIFHRWQAVNQQWKVLNYDKSQDCEDLKDPAVDRTLSQPVGLVVGGGDSQHPRVGVSASTSSLMVAASSTAGSTTTTAVMGGGAVGAGVHGDLNTMTGLPDQHRPYNILHLLSHLRPPEARSQPSNGTRELVMRVTTVWGAAVRPFDYETVLATTAQDFSHHHHYLVCLKCISDVPSLIE